MVNKEQELQIKKYLKDKNLSEDLIMEILDHMILQIEERMALGQSFELAFDEVKFLWKEELKQEWDWIIKIPKIQINRVSKIRNIILKKTLWISIIWALVLIALANYFPKNIYFLIYEYSFYGLNVLMLGVMIFGVTKTAFTGSFGKNKFSTQHLLNPLFIGFWSGVLSFTLRSIELDIDVVYQGLEHLDFLIILKMIMKIMLWSYVNIYLILSSLKIKKDEKILNIK